MADLSTIFTGIRFENPFLLASAPPTESEANIMRAFEAGWGGVVTKTIGLHPVVNVRGPHTKFLRVDYGATRLSIAKRPASTLVASSNSELVSSQPPDSWVRPLSAIKKASPTGCLSRRSWPARSDKELANWQVIEPSSGGIDAVELNFRARI